jgi:DNA-binding MarR family transcriptional regulator
MSAQESEVLSLILHLFVRFEEIEKRVRNYGTDVPIFNAEIHTVSVIAENPGIHVSALASRFNITKGATSETVLKLVKKGLVRKEADPDNLSRLLLFTTDKGNAAHASHVRFHAMVEEMAKAVLTDVSSEHTTAISCFLRKLAQGLESIEAEM